MGLARRPRPTGLSAPQQGNFLPREIRAEAGRSHRTCYTRWRREGARPLRRGQSSERERVFAETWALIPGESVAPAFGVIGKRTRVAAPFVLAPAAWPRGSGRGIRCAAARLRREIRSRVGSNPAHASSRPRAHAAVHPALQFTPPARGRLQTELSGNSRILFTFHELRHLTTNWKLTNERIDVVHCFT